MTFLWVCPDGQERVRWLRKLFEATLKELNATEYAPLFHVTSENPATVDPFTLFVRPSWVVPFQTEPVTLLAPPTPSTVKFAKPHYLPQEQYENFLRATGGAVPTLSTEVAAE